MVYFSGLIRHQKSTLFTFIKGSTILQKNSLKNALPFVFKFTRTFCDNKNIKNLKILPSQKKFEEFKNEKEIILDFDEEKYSKSEILNIPEYLYQEKKRKSFTDPLFTQRGKFGIFDVPDLVEILKREKVQDIVVIKLPDDIDYCDQMIICTAISSRHLEATTEMLRKIYKIKSNKSDTFLKIDGEESKDWKAMDMENIVLHIFMKETREKYDIETLWAVGPEHDELTQRQEDTAAISMMEKHIKFLESLETK